MKFSKFASFHSLLILILIVSCSPSKKTIPPVIASVPPVLNEPKKDSIFETKEDAFFVNLFKSHQPVFDSVLHHRKEWNVQVIYTQVDRFANGIPKLTNFYFNRGNAGYFYPASTVKLPVALLALERLNELQVPGLTRNSTMITEAVSGGQTPVYNDPNTADGKPTIAQYIKKILLVSDNDAYNRLYEFLGQEYINSALHKKGYPHTQILHRLEIFLTEEENRRTNPIKFFDSSNRLLQSFAEQVNRKAYAKRNDFLGTGYYSNQILQNRPMDFSKKNRIALPDLHQILVSLIFPQAVPAAQRFNITEDDRQFVLKYMSQFPGESVYPHYDSSYQDAYVKFILYGGEKGTLPKNIRIFNKVGDAYGHLIDVAYVADFKNNIEFFVSAAIYCNKDGILNDNQYDYDSVGFPFLKNIGRVLYDLELARKKNIQPDLSPLIFNYDK